MDPFTLDQLRTFLVVVEEGSFSAAGRRLRRVQSAVSQSMATLEDQLGVILWDRSHKKPTLTASGEGLRIAIERLCIEADAVARLAEQLKGGLEAAVFLCVDALFPVSALVDLCRSFAEVYPTVDLRVDTQLMSAVSARVVSGAASLGVVSPLGVLPGLERRPLAAIHMVPVVAPTHRLAQVRGKIGQDTLQQEVQIVLSERQDKGVTDQAVLSQRTWRVADLFTKHALLRAGLGWGNLPEHLIRDDLKSRVLVKIQPEAWGPEEHRLLLSAVYRRGQMLGPAHRWLLEHLPVLCARDIAQK